MPRGGCWRIRRRVGWVRGMHRGRCPLRDPHGGRCCHTYTVGVRTFRGDGRRGGGRGKGTAWRRHLRGCGGTSRAHRCERCCRRGGVEGGRGCGVRDGRGRCRGPGGGIMKRWGAIRRGGGRMEGCGGCGRCGGCGGAAGQKVVGDGGPHCRRAEGCATEGRAPLEGGGRGRDGGRGRGRGCGRRTAEEADGKEGRGGGGGHGDRCGCNML